MGPNRRCHCVRHAKEWSWIRSECLKVSIMRSYEKKVLY